MCEGISSLTEPLVKRGFGFHTVLTSQEGNRGEPES